MNPEQPPRLIGLGAVALALRWLEELLSLVNGPLLMIGAGIAVVDLLTDGALTIAVPFLLFAWAISQALGIETQLLGCFARAREALRSRHGWAVAGWVVLGALLAFFAWQAGYVYAVMQAEHISEATALAQLGIPAAQWLGERVALGVGLVALSGWTRYHAPPKAAPSLEDERAQLERELALEPLRQQARAQRAIGAVGLARQTLAAARGKSEPEKPPTGPGSPVASPVRTPRHQDSSQPPAVLRLETPPEWRATPRRAAQAQAPKGTNRRRVRTPKVNSTDPVEQKARSVWVMGMSVTQLERAAGISRSAAGKYRRTFMAEEAQVPVRAQAVQ